MKKQHLVLPALLLALGCAGAQAGSIKGSLTGTKTQTSTGSPVTSSPVSYKVTITENKGALDELTIVESGVSTNFNTNSPYNDSYTPAPTIADPNPTPIPGTTVYRNSNKSIYTRTSKYSLGEKAFGGSASNTSTDTSSYSYTFSATDPAVLAPVVTDSGTSTPSASTNRYSDGGFLKVKNKGGKVEIVLSQPYSYSSGSANYSSSSSGNTITTIQVSTSGKPKMTLSSSDTYSYVETNQTPSSSSTTVKASGKAKGEVDAKIRSGARKILAKK